MSGTHEVTVRDGYDLTIFITDIDQLNEIESWLDDKTIVGSYTTMPAIAYIRKVLLNYFPSKVNFVTDSSHKVHLTITFFHAGDAMHFKLRWL